MSENKNTILDLVNNLNIAEYEYHRHRFSNDIKDFIDEIMSTKYDRYQNYQTRQDFIKHMLEYIKMVYYIE